MAKTDKGLQNDIEAIRADIAALSDAVGKLASEMSRAQAVMAKTVKKAAKDAAGAGEDIMEEAMHLGRDTAEAAADATHAGMSSIEQEIKRSPIRSVLVALGVGFLVGIIGHR